MKKLERTSIWKALASFKRTHSTTCILNNTKNEGFVLFPLILNFHPIQKHRVHLVNEGIFTASIAEGNLTISMFVIVWNTFTYVVCRNVRIHCSWNMILFIFSSSVSSILMAHSVGNCYTYIQQSLFPSLKGLKKQTKPTRQTHVFKC